MALCDVCRQRNAQTLSLERTISQSSLGEASTVKKKKKDLICITVHLLNTFRSQTAQELCILLVKARGISSPR